MVNLVSTACRHIDKPVHAPWLTAGRCRGRITLPCSCTVLSPAACCNDSGVSVWGPKLRSTMYCHTIQVTRDKAAQRRRPWIASVACMLLHILAIYDTGARGTTCPTPSVLPCMPISPTSQSTWLACYSSCCSSCSMCQPLASSHACHLRGI